MNIIRQQGQKTLLIMIGFSNSTKLIISEPLIDSGYIQSLVPGTGTPQTWRGVWKYEKISHKR